MYHISIEANLIKAMMENGIVSNLTVTQIRNNIKILRDTVTLLSNIPDQFVNLLQTVDNTRKSQSG